MNYKYDRFKLLLIFISLFFSINTRAQEVLPYLFIQYDDKEIIELKLSNDFSIDHHLGFLEIHSYSIENSLMIPLNSISSIGFIYKDNEEDAGVKAIIDTQMKGIWQIFDIEGRLIRATKSDAPDLDNLPPGNIFIIKNEGTSYKYIPCK